MQRRRGDFVSPLFASLKTQLNWPYVGSNFVAQKNAINHSVFANSDKMHTCICDGAWFTYISRVFWPFCEGLIFVKNKTLANFSEFIMHAHVYLLVSWCWSSWLLFFSQGRTSRTSWLSRLNDGLEISRISSSTISLDVDFAMILERNDNRLVCYSHFIETIDGFILTSAIEDIIVTFEGFPSFTWKSRKIHCT